MCVQRDSLHIEGCHQKSLALLLQAIIIPGQMRQEELTLLQILSSQVSKAWENMLLMEEVVEARNEAHRLLLQVLDDQRTKELILESIPSGLITTDSDGHITHLQSCGSNRFGLSS